MNPVKFNCTNICCAKFNCPIKLVSAGDALAVGSLRSWLLTEGSRCWSSWSKLGSRSCRWRSSKSRRASTLLSRGALALHHVVGCRPVAVPCTTTIVPPLTLASSHHMAQAYSHAVASKQHCCLKITSTFVEKVRHPFFAVSFALSLNIQKQCHYNLAQWHTF